MFATLLAAAAAGIPLIYVLVLLSQGLLALLGTPTTGGFFVRALLGAAVGCGVAALLGLKGTMQRLADSPRALVSETLRYAIALRVPTAFVIACGFNIPDVTTSRIALGLLWGAVAAGASTVDTVVIDRRPAGDAIVMVVMFEVLFGFALIIGVINGLGDHSVLVGTLELVPAAGLGCILTFLVARLVDISVRASGNHSRRLRRPPDDVRLPPVAGKPTA